MNKIQICDCTLRDGGYYTNWDFNESLVINYFTTMNAIPAITHIEIGYRSKPMSDYYGEYYYCPDHVLRMAKEYCPNQQLAIMLNEKDTKIEDLDELLNPCVNYVDLVRLAVDPKNLLRSVELAKAIKSKGFKIGFNLMYMSQWSGNKDFILKLSNLEGIADYVYMVDSFGGVYPENIKNALETILEKINIPIGFHGHNNLELGLANTLSAIENGCHIVDATITGMGRGAGNLKTELLLTCLNAKEIISVDFNKLNQIVTEFENMQKQYLWGTNFPYMISGAYSLSQKDVMSWIAKRRYTTESIVNALQNKKNNLEDNYIIPVLINEPNSKQIIIIGGGSNTQKHAHALRLYCSKNPEIVLVHAGTRFVKLFNDLSNRQYICLLGAEGYKLQKVISNLNFENIKCVLEPSPRKMGTILPDKLIDITFELRGITFINEYPDTLLTIAFQLAIELKSDNVYLFGLDGYDLNTDEQMLEVSKENQILINSFLETEFNLKSLTPSNYQGFETISIYSKL